MLGSPFYKFWCEIFWEYIPSKAGRSHGILRPTRPNLRIQSNRSFYSSKIANKISLFSSEDGPKSSLNFLNFSPKRRKTENVVIRARAYAQTNPAYALRIANFAPQKGLWLTERIQEKFETAKRNILWILRRIIVFFSNINKHYSILTHFNHFYLYINFIFSIISTIKLKKSILTSVQDFSAFKWKLEAPV